MLHKCMIEHLRRKALLTYGFTKMDYSGTDQNMSDPSNSDNNLSGSGHLHLGRSGCAEDE